MARCGVVYGTAAQYCALAPCSSDFETCLMGRCCQALAKPQTWRTRSLYLWLLEIR